MPDTSDDRLPPPPAFSENLAVAPILRIMPTHASFQLRVKICGLIDADQVRQVVQAGADAVGLNRVASSPRFVHEAKLAELAKSAKSADTRALTVAVVTDPGPAELERWADQHAVDLIQLHGDESPHAYTELPLPFIRTIRIQSEPVDQALKSLEPWLTRRAAPHAILVDAWSPSALGGTGKTADWDLAAELVERLRPMPVILAGGLTPENVAEAIGHVRPAGVDAASGVERSPGDKDMERVREFVRRAKAALSEWQ